MNPLPGFWEATDWDAVSGVSGGVAAVAAAVATWLALRSIRLGQESQRVDKESHYFNAIVVAPSRDQVQSFRLSVEETLLKFPKEVKSLRGAGAGASSDLAQRAISFFNDEFYTLHHGLMANAEAWQDTELESSLRFALEILQDDVTESIDQFSRHNDTPEPLTLVRAGTGRLLKLLVDTDPVIRQDLNRGWSAIGRRLLQELRARRWHL